MFSKSTTLIAALTLGSALLLAPEFSTAVTIKLDGFGEKAPRSVVYAVETLAESTQVGRFEAYHLTSPGGSGSEELKVAVTVKRRVARREKVYVRLEFGDGLVFKANADPVLEVIGSHTGAAIDGTGVSYDDRISGGEAGTAYVVFRITGPIRPL